MVSLNPPRLLTKKGNFSHINFFYFSDDGFNPFDGLDVRFLNSRTVNDNNADHDLNIGINNVQNIDEFAHRKHI